MCCVIAAAAIARAPQASGLAGGLTPHLGARAAQQPSLHAGSPRMGLAQAGTGLSKRGAALNRCFQGFLGRLFFVVLNAGLGVCDAPVEGKRGSFVSVTVRSVQNNMYHTWQPHAVCFDVIFGRG